MPTVAFLHALFSLFLSLRLSTSLGILGNETDKLALLAFKSQITHDPLGVLSSWNDSSHFCEWGGITCSHRRQRVISLVLSSKRLVGTISPNIGNLSFLREFRLNHNNFHDQIPNEIGKLFRLEGLWLRNNSLGGKIPRNISFCFNLVTLFMSHNSFFGNVPIEVWSLPKLVNLLLEETYLTGEIPPSLGNTTSLVNLGLSGNNLGGHIPSTLGQLKLLVFFTLRSNNIIGVVPPSLYNLSSLVTIDIGLNYLVGYLPPNIGLTLPNLESLLIAGNQFHGPIPLSLANASKLQEVDIGSNQFSGKVPTNLGNLNDIYSICLRDNYLGTGKSGDLDFISPLTNCSNLQTLYISINQFGGTFPSSVGNLSNIEKLSLRNNHIAGRIPSQFGGLQNLYLLNMEANLFNGGIPTSFGNMQKLQVLRLGDNQLSGHVPSFLKNLSQLFELTMQKNFLEGSIAWSLDCPNLQTLDLSYNKFIGIIPNDISLLSKLLNLNLAHNLLSGSIPIEVGKLKNLLYFDVSDNKISGVVPNIFGNLLLLENIELEANLFQGFLPASLGSLLDLRSLDVSNNNFSGLIPIELGKLSVLASLNMSFNNFEGEVPSQGIFQNASAFSITANHKICGGIPDLGLPKCHFQKSKTKRVKFASRVILITIGSLVIIGIFVCIFVWRKPKGELQLPFEFCREYFIRVSYHDLFKATNGFSLTNLVGTGRYGSVYKGILQQFERPVAVKVLNLMESGALKTFMAECEALRTVRHRCLLKILTVCSSVDQNGDDFKAIVFDFMDNGSLESWLHPTLDGRNSPRSLNLYKRLEVATNIASALDYLHNHCEIPIAHCDLNPSNILLDDVMDAFVSDFGLAKFSKIQSSSSGNEASSISVRGSIGYIPPEYGMGSNVSTQGDVYSYGILLLEIFTGKRPTDFLFGEKLNLHNLCKTALVQGLMGIIDTRILSEETYYENAGLGNEMRECLSSIIRMGVACSVDVMTERMDIKDVLKEMISLQIKLNPILN